MDKQPPLHIFAPGRHTAMSGDALRFAESDLIATAAAYDPAKHEAPLVVGHPSHDAPAYGWVKSLAYADGLMAEPDQVDPDFAEMVAAGRFKKISASFYTPDSPQNPAPGVYYLRHVGFLGAQPPAVKGLRAPSFGDHEAGVIEFADWADQENASLWRQLREWIIGKFGLDEADKVIPYYQVNSLVEAAREDAAGSEIPVEVAPAAFVEPAPAKEESMTEEERQHLTALETENARLKADAASFAERETALRQAEQAARSKALAESVDDLVRQGQVLPKDRAGLLAYMAGPNEAGVIEFGEGDGKQSVAAADWLHGFLAALPVQIDFAERGQAEAPGHSVNFAAAHGYGVDANALEVHRLALAWQQAHPNTDYLTAVQAVALT